MKLVTALQIKECDRRTIAGEKLPPTLSLELMERAAAGIHAALQQHFSHLAQRAILVLCGGGNNGGDGLAVARRLHEQGHRPIVFLLADIAHLSPDARTQYDRFLAAGGRLEIMTSDEQLGERVSVALAGARVYPPLLVDALLGTGSRGAPRDLLAAGVNLIGGLRAEYDAEVLAIDLPTGIDADTGHITGEAVEADLTVTLARAKVGFLFYPARSAIGQIRVVDIGIPRSVEEDVGLPFNLMTREEAALLLPLRAPDAHKSKVGRLLVIGGSPGLTGAPSMASLAAVRTGSGLVTAAIPAGLNSPLEAKLTEVMTLPCPENASGGLALAARETILAREKLTDVWALGPGMGRDPETMTLALRLIERLPGKMVVDADGLFALAGQRWQRPAGAPPPVLTPHPGEMARLTETDVERIAASPVETAQRYASERGCILVLKGAPTVVAAPGGEVWINPTGTAALATGGSGDVLTGIIASLLGQGLAPLDAARLGVFVHGWAGERVVAEQGLLGLAPPDVIAHIPATLHALRAGLPYGSVNHWVSAAEIMA